MSTFQFKQFSIQQNQAAMKVGTDSILLGSWAHIADEFSILDIGTGTGLLALMLAQRSDAETIDAVEIDQDAYVNAVTNFENSDWADRLFCYHTSIQEFGAEIDESYDHIISNPPYFNPSNTVNSRSIARQTHLLSHITLLEITKKLLSKNGIASFIIPFDIETIFITTAINLDLFVQRITRVKDTQNTEHKRSLIEFGFNKKEFITTELILKNDDKSYSDSFIALTKEYYLDF